MRRGRPPHDDILTPREWQVVDLLAEGLTNEEIAERLGVSFGAAKYHVAEILSKLGVQDRRAAVEAARRRRQRGFVALPPLAWLAGAAAVLVLFVLAGVVLQGRGETGHKERPPSVPAQPDEAQAASPFPNTLLLTRTMPVNVGEHAPTIASLRTVRTLGELRAALGPQIQLIVIDQSAVGELRGSDLISKEANAGRAIMGLNFCLEYPFEEQLGVPPTPYTGPVWETSPSGETRYYYPTGAPPSRCSIAFVAAGLPYFSFHAMPPIEQRPQIVGGRPLPFMGGALMRFMPGDGAFERILRKLDAGERTDLLPGAPQFCQSQLPDGSWRSAPCAGP